METKTPKLDGMSFGLAIEAVKKGATVRRRAWEDDSTYLLLEINEALNIPLITIYRPGTGGLLWAPDQTSMMTEDWEIIDTDV